MILGQEPPSVSVIEKVLATNPQLSLALPPPAINSASVVKADGTSPTHSPVTFDGHVIAGGSGSSIVMVCTHCPVFPHESAIVYVLVMILGQVPASVSFTVNEFASNPQLSDALPPPAINAASVLNAGGTSPAHSSDTFAGHVINGGTGSSIVMVCTH